MKSLAAVAAAMFVFELATVWQVFGAVELRLTNDGGLTFDGGRLSVSAFRVGWTGYYPVKVDWTGHLSGDCKFRICRNAVKIFDGKDSWTMQDDGTVKGVVSLTCVAPAEVQCLALQANIPAVPPFGLGDGTAQDYELPVDGGRAIQLHFDAPVRYHAQDSRQWGGAWSVRFGKWQGRRKYAVGDRLEWNVTLSSPDGLSLKRMKPCVISEGDEWVKMDHRKDVKPGSALDLSAQGLQDAPAGKHGWLKAKNGHFEFEGLPGMEQRFYGVNLCFTANYLDHATADRLVDRLVRCGYNTIRVHHHDGIWSKALSDAKNAKEHKDSSAVSATPRAENSIDRLDYLVAKCIERGIYITTDLYVSRPVMWREIGIDRDGEMKKSLYRTYIGIYAPAFTNWCSFTKKFLSHVNPYTGRAYKDEPGMPLVSLINEGRLGMGWDEKKGDEKILAAWHEFGGKGDLTPSRGRTRDDLFCMFDEHINAKIWKKCSAYVRSLGAKALLTNDNNGRWHAEGEGLTPCYDYVDNHVYVDHPHFLDEPWRLPSRCWNKNPIRMGRPSIFHAGWAKGSAKPYTITEWNFSGPGHYRGMGGILTGALAAEQEWDGLWRFAYSHSNANLRDNPNGGPGYFDCVTDPIIAASDRASVCLYLRGDAAQIENVKCKMENGKCVRGVWIDKDNGSMTIVTPRTCGGFTESGPIEAGPLSFSVCTNATMRRAVPTTLWVSTLDGKAIRESSRMLLTHLTDVQGGGTKFADEARTILLKWGRGYLAEIGATDVSLRLNEPQRYQVWVLASDGERRFEVPCRVEKGALCFTASVAGPNGAQMFYEILSH